MSTIPFFKHASLREIIITRLCCGADLVVILCCAGYLVGRYPEAGLRWPWLIVALLAGYFLADLFSGLVHWVVDTWLDEGMLGRGIAITREHHTHPGHVLLYDFLDQASLGAAPSALLVGIAAAVTALFPVSALTYALMIVWFVIATCMLFGMSFTISRTGHTARRSCAWRNGCIWSAPPSITGIITVTTPSAIVSSTDGPIIRATVSGFGAGWSGWSRQRRDVRRGPTMRSGNAD